MKIAIVVFFLTLTGCAFAPISPQEQSQCGARPSEAEMAGAVQAYIGQQNWKDADSVKVRNTQSSGCVARQIGGLLNGGHRFVGWEIDFEVNAKNSYGGYSGFEPRWVLKTAAGQSLRAAPACMRASRTRSWAPVERVFVHVSTGPPR